MGLAAAPWGCPCNGRRATVQALAAATRLHAPLGRPCGRPRKLGSRLRLLTGQARRLSPLLCAGPSTLPGLGQHRQCRRCSVCHAAAGGGASGGSGNEDGGDGGSGGNGGSLGAAAAAVGLGPGASKAAEDVILLDVAGMRCAGCVSRVKALLEQQQPVTAASVNLATETALVRVVLPPPDASSSTAPLAAAITLAAGVSAGAKVGRGGGGNGVAERLLPGTGEQQQGRDDAPSNAAAAADVEAGMAQLTPHQRQLAALGGTLAALLTDHGYAATVRQQGEGSGAAGRVLTAKREERKRRMRQATRRLGVAWLLASACLAHHAAHFLGAAAPAWLHRLAHATPLHAALSALALLGPGRQIISEGFKALVRGGPDMNSLVGLGATASFGVSLVAAALPGLGWRTFFEEPAMLLGVVLAGRALEERAKLRASADMAALQGLLPPKARVLLGDGSWREVPSEAVAAGDVLAVLPGDRLPVDGVVVGGRSTVDESALTGEPLPVTKAAGDKVTAGTLNYDGQITVRAEHSGGDTAVADIVRMVEAAQSRAAPVQRFADVVAGRFTYGVMAAAAVTFVFWAGIGTRAFPQVLAAAQAKAAAGAAVAAPLLLSLQMACNVLVVACPCALGLAAPTAVLVGTSAGARRGLLIRGGDILEAASRVDTVVFDKTGTLTAGKPTVVTVRPVGALVPPSSSSAEAQQGQQQGRLLPTDPTELLLLAAAVERGSTHPIARAIARAAEGAAAAGSASSDDGSSGNGSGGSSSKSTAHAAEEGSFVQEPGSGVTASVGGRRISVGTLEWITQQREEQQQTQAAVETAPAAAAAGGGGNGSASSNGSGGSGLATSSCKALLDSAAAISVAAATAAAAVHPGHILVFVGVDGQLAGAIEVADELRPDAAATVAALRSLGVQSIMLSGDQPATAHAIAAAVGIPPASVHAGVRPAGKAALVASLQQQGRRVAMVGDGVNDAAALAQADVGIAMGGGVDAASEVADVVLMGDRLPQVLDVLSLSRATLRKIKQNMWWAAGYNLIGIPLAAGALLPVCGLALTPSISGAMMGMSSLAVMANSLLLQFEGGRGSVLAASHKQQRQQQPQQQRVQPPEGAKQQADPLPPPGAASPA